jgi:hypothetical protein
MSDVPLPEPDFYCAPKSGKILSVQGYERGDHLQGLMRGHYEPVYYGHKLDAHAAAVSADLRAENARLWEALREYIDAADACVSGHDDVAAMLRFGEADKAARAALKGEA